MDHVRSGTIVLSWDAEKRLAVLIYEVPIRATGEQARPLLKAFDEWLAGDQRTFYFLNDCKPLLHMDTECRAMWWDFFRPHCQHAWAALYNMSPLIQIVAQMYRAATGIRMKGFSNEAAARVWLRQKGAAL
jgi:hypothetical protein